MYVKPFSIAIMCLLATTFSPKLHGQEFAPSIVDEYAVEIPDVSRVIADRFPLESPGGIGVLITRNGEVIHRMGYGSLKGKPLTAQTPLRLASISKQFAAICAAMLIEEGKVDPKAKVSHYLPEVNLPVKGR